MALILAYVAVTGADLAQSLRGRRPIRALFAVVGTLALLWPLYNSVYPAPNSPRDLWPFVVIPWIFAGAVLLAARPALLAADISSPCFRRPEPAAFARAAVGENSPAMRQDPRLAELDASG